MAADKVLIPTVLWAQRKDKLYLTLDIQDVQDQKITLENVESSKAGKLTFTGKAGAEKAAYALELVLFDEIDAEGSKVSVSPRHIFCVVMKKQAGEHWDRLTKESGRQLAQHIKCDWDKWVDEDDEEEGKDTFDMGSMGQFQDFDQEAFMGGMGGQEEEDSDDEDLPDLEK